MDDTTEQERDNVIEEGIKAPSHLQLLPARHTKTLYLVRHGEGYHNVAGKQGYHMYSRKVRTQRMPCALWHGKHQHMKALQEYYDAHLTEFG